MHLYINTTSPFVRMIRIIIAEKGLNEKVKTEIVDPWIDPKIFLHANPSGRVPVLTTDSGTVIVESSLIMRFLDQLAPESAIWPKDGFEQTLALAGHAIGAIEAAVAVIISRKSNDRFDTHAVGQRRFRTMASAFTTLNANLPRDMAERVDLANVATITALDYILFRFPDRDWLNGLPKLKAWHDRHKDRPSLVQTFPHILK